MKTPSRDSRPLWLATSVRLIVVVAAILVIDDGVRRLLS